TRLASPSVPRRDTRRQSSGNVQKKPLHLGSTGLNVRTSEHSANKMLLDHRIRYTPHRLIRPSLRRLQPSKKSRWKKAAAFTSFPYASTIPLHWTPSLIAAL